MRPRAAEIEDLASCFRRHFAAAKRAEAAAKCLRPAQAPMPRRNRTLRVPRIAGIRVPILRHAAG